MGNKSVRFVIEVEDELIDPAEAIKSVSYAMRVSLAITGRTLAQAAKNAPVEVDMGYGMRVSTRLHSSEHPSPELYGEYTGSRVLGGSDEG